MFGQYPFIAKQHAVALESVIRNHGAGTTVSAGLLAKMYKVALAGLTQPSKEEGLYTSQLRAEKVTMSSVTDVKSGIWIQLATIEGFTGSIFMTCGQKWTMEQPVPQHGNVTTVIW